MIVCHCTGTTDREIRELCQQSAASGAAGPFDASLEGVGSEIGRSCGAGEACRGCRATIEEIVRQLASRR